MSKFDKERARAQLHLCPSVNRTVWEGNLNYFLSFAIDHIDALEARIAKLEAVREAAARFNRRHAAIEIARLGEVSADNLLALQDALAACDDGEGT